MIPKIVVLASLFLWNPQLWAPPSDAIKVEMKGTIKASQMAIGGETSGILLDTKEGEIELFFSEEGMKKKALNLDGKMAFVRGSLSIQKGVEISVRVLAHVSFLKPIK